MAVLFFLPYMGLGTLLNAVTWLTVCLYNSLGREELGFIFITPFYFRGSQGQRSSDCESVMSWAGPTSLLAQDLSISSPLGRAEAAKIVLQESF